MGIRDRKQSVYAQAITNRRLLAIKGNSSLEFSIRWQDVAGMNKVTRNNMPSAFGVRDRAGRQCLFRGDLFMVEKVITQCCDSPRFKEEAPEVAFDPMPL